MLSLKLRGQIRGGKNNVLVLKSGLRIPPKVFREFAKQAIEELKQQLPPFFMAYDRPISASIIYTPGDKRKRDVPALMDGLWHVLEKAGLVTDDCLIGGFGELVKWRTMDPDSKSAGAVIYLDVGA